MIWAVFRLLMTLIECRMEERCVWGGGRWDQLLPKLESCDRKTSPDGNMRLLKIYRIFLLQ